MELNYSPDPHILKTHLTVWAAAEVLGVVAQYLRRLLWTGWLKEDQIGQVWMMSRD
jgi:hypothetical protein